MSWDKVDVIKCGVIKYALINWNVIKCREIKCHVMKHLPCDEMPWLNDYKRYWHKPVRFYIVIACWWIRITSRSKCLYLYKDNVITLYISTAELGSKSKFYGASEKYGSISMLLSLWDVHSHKMQPLCPKSRVSIKDIWLQFSFENSCSFPQNLTPLPSLAGHVVNLRTNKIKGGVLGTESMISVYLQMAHHSSRWSRKTHSRPSFSFSLSLSLLLFYDMIGIRGQTTFYLPFSSLSLVLFYDMIVSQLDCVVGMEDYGRPDNQQTRRPLPQVVTYSGRLMLR